MSREEVVAFSQHLRTLRSSPPTFTKQLRDDEEIAEDSSESEQQKSKSKKPKADPSKLLTDLLERAKISQQNQKP